MKIKSIHYVIFFVVIGVGGLAAAQIWGKNQPGRYDTLAQCIADSGATFYGAFWCPHCQDQKRIFGSASQYLPYVECSTPDGNAQTQICIDEEITSYPTWKLADGTVLDGVRQPADLAAATNCAMPE